jgi:hypothetical protein
MAQYANGITVDGVFSGANYGKRTMSVGPVIWFGHNRRYSEKGKSGPFGGYLLQCKERDGAVCGRGVLITHNGSIFSAPLAEVSGIIGLAVNLLSEDDSAVEAIVFPEIAENGGVLSRVRGFAVDEIRPLADGEEFPDNLGEMQFYVFVEKDEIDTQIIISIERRGVPVVDIRYALSEFNNSVNNPVILFESQNLLTKASSVRILPAGDCTEFCIKINGKK